MRSDDPAAPGREQPAAPHLVRTAAADAEIDALAAALAADGGGRVGLAAAARDLPHRLRRSRAPHPRLLGRAVARAWTWEPADRADRDWWPQGIATSAGTGGATSLGRDLLAVSWYSKRGAGCRISLVDPARRRYGHVLLVTPTLVDGEPGLAPLKVHAGGIAWHGEHLHVAGTGRGFSSARLADVLRVPAGSPYRTWGHRYVLPVRLAHRSVAGAGADRLRFSFLDLDRGVTPPAIVAGEYGRSLAKTRRVFRIPADPVTGLPRVEPDGPDGRVVPEVAVDAGPVRMQGVTVVDGDYHLSSSLGWFLPGTMYVGRPGGLRRHLLATPIGPEDLTHWPATGAVWTVTEHPRRRWIAELARERLRRTP